MVWPRTQALPAAPQEDVTTRLPLSSSHPCPRVGQGASTIARQVLEKAEATAHDEVRWATVRISRAVLAGDRSQG